MKGMKVIAAAAVIIALVAAGFWWLQQQREADQAAHSALIVREQPVQLSTQPQKTKPAPTEAKLPVVAAEDGSFTVQISSWRSSMKAEREAERFQSAGYASFVQRVYLPEQGAWYRVRVGQFRTRDEAERLAAELVVQLDSEYWITHKQ